MSGVDDTGDFVAVYASLKEAQQQPASTALKPIPSYQLYKVAREEELGAYRGLCRSLSLHYTKDDLPKSLRRVLEDVRDELFISEERGQLEWESAQGDAVLAGVRRSGVLTRREVFFDGAEDVSLAEAVQHAVDDGSAVACPPSKLPRTEGYGGAGDSYATAGAAAAANRPNRKKSQNAANLVAVKKIGKEVVEAAQQLLYATSESAQKEKVAFLEEKKAALVRLKQQIEADG